MPPHQNRSKRSPTANPNPAEIRAARLEAGLTQTEAAELVHVGLRAWQRYEEGSDDGKNRMHPGLWALFKIRLAERAAAKVMDGIPRGP